MKKPISILILFCMVAAFAACKKQQLLTYNADDNIYFFYKRITSQLDSLDFSFAYSPAGVTDSTLNIPVAVTGVPANRDREFAVVVDPSSTAQVNVHYQLPQKFVLRAGSLVDSFSIKLLRAPDLQSSTAVLRLNLVPNDNFHTDIKAIASSPDSIQLLSFKINLSDMLTQGNYWSGVFATYFGDFSVKKLRLINEIAGMPLDYVINGIYDINMAARCAAWAITMSRYLDDQQQAGHTVYNEDGVTPMTMGAGYL